MQLDTRSEQSQNMKHHLPKLGHVGGNRQITEPLGDDIPI